MSGFIHTTHKDRYRLRFCDVHFYTQQNVFALWKTHLEKSNPVEKLAAWSVALCCLRRPDDWFAGERRKSFQSSQAPASNLSLHELLQLSSVKWPKSLPSDMSLTEFLQKVRIKAVPEPVLESLYSILQVDYPIDVITHIPSPQEILQKQISGRRIVSFNENFSSWPEFFVSERDYLGFILHDLMHAYHFFKTNKNQQGQRGFYLLMQSLLNEDSLTTLLQTKFNSDFDYMIADMNAHPLHLLKTLQAQSALALQNNRQSEHIWAQWVHQWKQKFDLDQNEISALEKINKQDFFVEHAELIEQLCIKIGQT